MRRWSFLAISTFIFRFVLINLFEDHIEVILLFFDFLHLLFESLLIDKNGILSWTLADKGTNVLLGKLELVFRVFWKQFVIIAPDRPDNTFVNTIRKLVFKFSSLFLLLYSLLSFILIFHFWCGTFYFHDVYIVVGNLNGWRYF